MIRPRSVCPSLFLGPFLGLLLGLCWAAGCGMPETSLPMREVPQIPLEVSTGQLEELFDEIIEKTERREAFSEVKEEALSYSPLADMKALRSEFVAVESEADLYYALVKLSNARRDRHLSVNPVDGGLDVPITPELVAPLHVLPDYSDLDNPSFFVARVGMGLSSPEPGDLIVAVNGRSIAEYVEEFTSWIRHSSLPGLYWHMARELPLLVPGVPLDRYSETLNLTLENAAGEQYDVSLAYGDAATHTVGPDPQYPDFEMVLERENFRVHVNGNEQIVLLQWLDFEFSLIQDVLDLMELAERDELLDFDLIIDVRGSSGGSFGAYAIQRLVSQPFRTTFGNVRLSDAGEELIERFQNLEIDESAPDIFGLNLSRSWLRDWARTDAAEAILRGGRLHAAHALQARAPAERLGRHPAAGAGALPGAPSHRRRTPRRFASGPVRVHVRRQRSRAGRGDAGRRLQQHLGARRGPHLPRYRSAGRGVHVEHRAHASSQYRDPGRQPGGPRRLLAPDPRQLRDLRSGTARAGDRRDPRSVTASCPPDSVPSTPSAGRRSPG